MKLNIYQKLIEKYRKKPKPTPLEYIPDALEPAVQLVASDEEYRKNEKIDPRIQLEIVRLLAWYRTPSEIAKFVKTTFGRDMQTTNIVYYEKANKWRPVLQKFREEYENAISEVPLASKKKRLEELTKHYEHHMEKKDFKNAQSVLRDAREEMQSKLGDVNFNFTQITNNEFKRLSDEELVQQEKDAATELIRIRETKRKLGVTNEKETDQVY